jgi:hypothetical protein
MCRALQLTHDLTKAAGIRHAAWQEEGRKTSWFSGLTSFKGLSGQPHVSNLITSIKP